MCIIYRGKCIYLSSDFFFFGARVRGVLVRALTRQLRALEWRPTANCACGACATCVGQYQWRQVRGGWSRETGGIASEEGLSGVSLAGIKALLRIKGLFKKKNLRVS
jgi:hypothetical protein